MLRKALFRLAKAPWMGKVVGLVFQYGSWLLPVKKLYLSKAIIAFPHPRPSYDDHVILSPRKAVPNLLQIPAEGEVLAEIWQGVQAIRQSHATYQDEFTLVANGGPRQEVQQLHFHLFSRPSLVQKGRMHDQPTSILYHTKGFCIFRHPSPQWEHHFIIQVPLSGKAFGEPSELLECVHWLNDTFSLTQKGYSLVYSHDQTDGDNEPVFFHVTSGKKLPIE